MRNFVKNKKLMAMVVLLTFLFSCVMPSNIMAGNSVAEAAGKGTVSLTVGESKTIGNYDWSRTWSTNRNGVVKLSTTDGKKVTVTGEAAGTVTVTAKSKYSDSSDTWTVNVTKTTNNGSTEQTGFHKVAVVDTVAAGINIQMNNSKNKQFDSPGRYNGGVATQGMVKPNLGADGYPVFASGGGSLANYFGGTHVTGLFIQSEYADTGYYHYSSFENASILDENNVLQAYEELMTPKDVSPSKDLDKTPVTDRLYMRGNFLPYNEFGNAASKSKNIYDEYDVALTGERAGETLYLPKGGANNTDYYFGMTVSANFAQLKDGLVDGKEMRYEFTGDDDMWVFIDGVLVLDIGGIHHARSGYIDFSTGQVWAQDGGYTTIKEQFVKAGKYDAVDFDGETFADYTTHSIKVFYMERGDGASGLKIRFNLPTFAGNPQLQKLVEVNDEFIADDKEYQFYVETAKDDKGTDAVPYTGKVVVQNGGTTTESTLTDGKLTLTHSEIAAFDVNSENEHQYVRITEEKGITDVFDTVYEVDQVAPTVETKEGQTEGAQSKWHRIIPDTEQKLFYTFRNSVETNDLSITKNVDAANTDPNEEFDFKVYFKTYDETGLVEVMEDWTLYTGELVDGTKVADGIITLKADETATIEDIPVGTEYFITEVLPDDSEYRVKEDQVTEEIDNVDATGITGTITDEADTAVTVTNTKLGAIEFKKVGEDGKALAGATFVLYEKANMNPLEALVDTFIEAITGESDKYVKVPGVDPVESDENGLVKFEDLTPGTYYVKETAAPDSYIVNDKVHKATVVAGGTAVITVGDVEGQFVNKESIDISVKKVWDDADNQDGIRPTSVTVKLLADDAGTEKTLTLNEDNGWTDSFNDLVKTNENGVAINYTVVEENIVIPEGHATGYKAAVTGSMADGFIITNTHTPEKITISGEKIWDDANNQDGKRPSEITVNVMNGATVVASREVTAGADGKWIYSFENLPKYSGGNVINYTISEVDVTDYSTTYVNDSYNIINSYTPEETSVTVTKDWDDNYNQDGIRPDKVKVQLYANGEKTGDKVEVTAADNWKYTWTKLAKKANGKDIVYSVEEVNVPEKYTSDASEAAAVVASGFVTITNAHTPENVTVSGTKTWVDNSNAYSTRPETVALNLYKQVNDEEPQAVTGVTPTWTNKDSDVWKWEYTGLAKYENGDLVTYTVKEVTIDNYNTTYGENNAIINTLTGTTSVEVVKAWDDANNQDGIRPESITVHLFANGEEVAEQKIEENQNSKTWGYTFEKLPKYENGVKIVYTVTEDEVANYTSDAYNAKAVNDDGKVTINNTHIPETVSVEVEKVWDDANNQDGKRPEDITVQLFANNVEVTGKTLTLDKADNWAKDNFTGLAKYENGVEINYTVKEVGETANKITFNNAVYRVVYEKTAAGYKITNTHEPEVITISGAKTWADADNVAGFRPDSIIVKLMNGNIEVASAEVTAATANAEGEWEYTFGNRPKYANGEEINYTVKEVGETDNKITFNGAVYTVAYSGYDITNKYVPETVEVKGTKTWIDNNNKYNTRPDSIRVNLFANGEKLTDKEITAADGWTYAFTDLPKYQNREEVVYTVEEVVAPGYDTKIDGFNITNTIAQQFVTISANKVWENLPAEEDVPNFTTPSAITLVLTQDGAEYERQVVTANDEGEWNYTFANLPKFDTEGDGHAYKYVLREEPLEGYVTSYELTKGAEPNVYNVEITNTYVDTNNVVTVKGVKRWNDIMATDLTEAIVHPTIVIRLLQDGEPYQAVTLENGEEKFAFTNLPKYYEDEFGYLQKHEYTVAEDPVPGYWSAINYDENGYVITNTLATKALGLLTVQKLVTGGNAPADSEVEFILRVDAQKDLMAIDANVQAEAANLEAKYNEAIYNQAAAGDALGIAAYNFKHAAYLTTESAYQFILVDGPNHNALFAVTKGSATTPSALYSFDGSDTFTPGEAEEQDETLIDQLILIIKDVLANLASVFDIPIFMDQLSDEVAELNSDAEASTPSALAFDITATAEWMMAHRNAAIADGMVEATHQAWDDFVNEKATTPSAITVTITDTKGDIVDGYDHVAMQPDVHDNNTYNDIGRYYNIPFTLKAGTAIESEPVNVIIESTTGTAIRYQIFENRYEQNEYDKENSKVQITRNGEVVENEETWTPLSMDTHYSFAFTNAYTDTIEQEEEHFTPPSDPNPPTPPTTPEPEPQDIEIPEEEVPLAEPGIEIVEPDVPLGDAPEEMFDDLIPLGDAPATGDTTNTVPFLCMLLVGLVGFLVSRTKFN